MVSDVSADHASVLPAQRTYCETFRAIRAEVFGCIAGVDYFILGSIPSALAMGRELIGERVHCFSCFGDIVSRVRLWCYGELIQKRRGC